MDRVTIRARGQGAVGYVRLLSDARISLAQLREQINSQLGGQVPAAFHFVSGGLPVSPAQEELEELIDSEVFIMAAEPGAHGSHAGSHAGSRQSGSPTLLAQPCRRSSFQSLVQQWVEAFGYMEEREQTEAISLLRLQHPALMGAAATKAKAVKSSPPAASPAAMRQLPPWKPPSQVSAEVAVELAEWKASGLYARGAFAGAEAAPPVEPTASPQGVDQVGLSTRIPRPEHSCRCRPPLSARD